MPRNATGDPEIERLRQLPALESLLAGCSVLEAAEAAGVSRETVHRWKREDWAFQAALNRGQRDIQEAIRGRLLAAAGTATTNVAGAIEDGDLRSSITLLKGLGSLSGQLPPIGSDDPEVVREEAYIAEKTEKLMRKLCAPG